jgi:hypothetical protein
MARKSKSTTADASTDASSEGTTSEATVEKKTRKPREKVLFILEEQPEGQFGETVVWRNAALATTFDDRKSAEAYPVDNNMAGTFRVVPCSKPFTIKLEQTTIAKRV